MHEDIKQNLISKYAIANSSKLARQRKQAIGKTPQQTSYTIIKLKNCEIDNTRLSTIAPSLPFVLSLTNMLIPARC